MWLECFSKSKVIHSIARLSLSLSTQTLTSIVCAVTYSGLITMLSQSGNRKCPDRWDEWRKSGHENVLWCCRWSGHQIKIIRRGLHSAISHRSLTLASLLIFILNFLFSLHPLISFSVLLAHSMDAVQSTRRYFLKIWIQFENIKILTEFNVIRYRRWHSDRRTRN